MFSRFKSNSDLNAEQVADARQYIDGFWSRLTRHNAKGDQSLIGLPHPYIVPAFTKGEAFHFEEMYYWDTYFILQGLLVPKYKTLAVGMVDNLLYVYNKLSIIPNANRSYLTGRSQPPLLTSMIWDVYQAFDLDKSWLDRAIDVALREYHNVWIGESKPHIRRVFSGLSRYYDINHVHDLAEAESGWDMTTRFSRKALDYLPVDLNALLYKYEKDFAEYFKLCDDKESAQKWLALANQRSQEMRKLMWSATRGLYMDYNYQKQKRSNISSLASFYPMWVGMVDDDQAAAMVKALKSRFEKKGGLSTTDMPFAGKNPGPVPAQWAYPNGWAPLHFIVVQGLERYGFSKDARRITMKWLATNLQWFEQNQQFLEKYNVVNPSKEPARGLYPAQTGFGWTNAVFERLCKDYIDANKQTNV